MTRKLQAVLWDMDGTIVDTEPYWFNAEAELLDAYGKSWSPEQSEALIGNALPLSAVALQEAGVDLGIREIINRLTDSVAAQVRQRVPWRPGARQLLQQLRDEAIPCALVTMSETTLAHEVVAQLPPDTFSVQVTGESVVHGKPEPDAYLLAANRIAEHHADETSLSIDNMVAIEDSLTGVTSALTAGLATVGVPNIVPLSPQPGLTIWSTLADKTIEDLAELLTMAPRIAGSSATLEVAALGGEK